MAGSGRKTRQVKGIVGLVMSGAVLLAGCAPSAVPPRPGNPAPITQSSQATALGEGSAARVDAKTEAHQRVVLRVSGMT